MSRTAVSTSLSITNPLVLYRSLLASKKLQPDPAQHRLALYLQDLYFRLKDYNPEIEYRQRLDQATRSFAGASDHVSQQRNRTNTSPPAHSSFLSSLFQNFPNSSAAQHSTLSLIRTISIQESARTIQSPRGLLLHGEVGRGKSMLLDLIFQSLPSSKKQRYHFTTFMLDIFRRIERERISRLSVDPGIELEHVVLSLARESIATNPILFLDEFQLPDRASSKLLSSFMTSFFHLGGVLVASSNRMPEELAKAQGVEFTPRPPSRFDWKGGYSRWSSRSSEGEKAAKSDFAEFLEVLKARCDVWEMEGNRDWRREKTPSTARDTEGEVEKGDGKAFSSSTATVEDQSVPDSADCPPYYHVPAIGSSTSSPSFRQIISRLNPTNTWTPTTIKVYGRTLHIASTYTPQTTDSSPQSQPLGQIHMYPFQHLCATNLGPADYISIASRAHTVIIHGVPVLTNTLKNEARRFITLLDALYEARCRLLIEAAAPPDRLFFPDMNVRTTSAGMTTESNHEPHQQHWQNSSTDAEESRRGENNITNPATEVEDSDSIYSESYSEIYQESTAPFRPNVSIYDTSTSAETHPLGSPSLVHNNTRSILADEDADFGPTYGNGRSSSAVVLDERHSPPVPDFTNTTTLTGTDERFAYKRARSRLWEMCGEGWWRNSPRHEPVAATDEFRSWWRPVGTEGRPWEEPQSKMENDDSVAGARQPPPPPPYEKREGGEEEEDKWPEESLSPYRRHSDRRPPPRFPWQHFWGMVRWGRRAGDWGLGVEGERVRMRRRLEEKVGSSDGDDDGNKRE